MNRRSIDDDLLSISNVRRTLIQLIDSHTSPDFENLHGVWALMSRELETVLASLEAHPQEKPAGCYHGLQRNAAASEPTVDTAESVFHQQMRQRMANLEDAYTNAPKITAAALEGWRARLSIVSGKVYGALETVELLNSEEREGTAFFGPLSLVKDALETAESDLAMLCSDLSDAKAKAPQDGTSRA